MAMSLNVSILPEVSERDSKPQYPSYAVASFYHLAKSDIHGVILVSNQPMLDRNNHVGGLGKVNTQIREMLVPIIVSPTGKYTVTDASSTTDQADISKAISKSVWNDGKRVHEIVPGLCVVGFAEEYLTEDIAVDDIASRLAKNALNQTTCEWMARFGDTATGYRAFLSGPPDFFESQPTKLTSELVTALTNEIRGRTEEPQRGRLIAIDGGISVQAFANADSVRISVLLYNVNIPELDTLVEDGLAPHGDSRGNIDGWDKILGLTEEQVARIERDQLNGTTTYTKSDDKPEYKI